MNSTVEKALNEQINAEMYSAYLYLSMSAWSDSKGMKGVSHWFRIQYQEEMMHAIKIFDFINDRGGTPVLEAIAAPPAEWKGIVDVFESVFKHEQAVTSSVNSLYNLAHTENDHASSTFLQWFVTEQVEEEANVKDILDQLRLAGGDGPGLFMIDRELATRPVPVDPNAKGQ